MSLACRFCSVRFMWCLFSGFASLFQYFQYKMSDVMRKRSPNWLPSEKELLLSLVEFHYNIIENKKTDGVTVRAKLAQWQIIADQYNSRTTHCSRTGENLKSQWESMKKVARKDAATNRKHMIQTGGGSPIPPKKEDPFQQRIISLISTSAIGLFNPYDNDSSVPAVQDQEAIAIVQMDNFPEAPQIEYIDTAMPSTTVIVNGQTSDTGVVCENQEFVKKDWGDYTPQLLRTPVSLALKNTVPNDNQTPHRTWVSRRRPTHSSTSSSLEQLHRKKIEAIELQTKLAEEEFKERRESSKRSKLLHDIDIQIKKQILKQEKLKANILSMKHERLLAFKKRRC